MFALRQLLALGGEQSEGPDQGGTGVGGVDHGVDVAALGGDVGVGVTLGVLLDELGPPRRPGPASRSELAAVDDLTAPCGPMTAISAVGQARLKSAPRCLESMTS